MHYTEDLVDELIEAELEHQVQKSERELQKIENIVELSKVRKEIEDLQVERQNAAKAKRQIRKIPANSA
jgi:hypothetical protein